MIRTQIRLGFGMIFENENSEDYLESVNKIPKDLLIDASTHLLSFYHSNSSLIDHKKFLSDWFGKVNNMLANEIYDKITKYLYDNSKEIVIINSIASLTLFEKVLSSDNKQIEISDSDFEILLFKVYLAINEQLNNNDDSLINSVKLNRIYPEYLCFAIANSLPTFDITNYDLHTIFVTQVIKSIFLFEFLDNRKDTQNLLREFFLKFEVSNYKEFLKLLFPISFFVISTKKTGKIDLTISHDEEYEANKKFLDKFTINTIDNEDKVVDYLNLRANPIIKISDNTYRIIFPLFVIEKNFNGLYFLLKEINDAFSEKERINLRQIITYDFSEKHILYSLIERAFKKKYFKLSGGEMTSDGTPDYYIRNGNKIFLFESKDILINAETKNSYDFMKYATALKDKLYWHSDEKKKSPKAVKQLANFSKKILEGTFKEDRNYKPGSAKIYPIILLHNRQLDIIGLNNLINIWFQNEIDSMVSDSINVRNLRMPTIIGIDTLILIHERLSIGEFSLDQILDDYQYFINEERLKTQRFKDENELLNAKQDQLISFNTYILNTYSWKIPNLFKEKGITIF